MTANPYSFGSLGERWTVGEPTSKDRLDKSRTKADANRWTLQQLLGDPDDTANFALAIPSTQVIDRISHTSSSIDAHKIVPFFLDEPAHVSPTFKWQQAIRKTSWYAELGAPPTHGAFVVDASQNAISWIDLDSATLAVYMTFTVGANNVLYSTSSNLSSIAALDFKIIVGATQMTLIDLLEDRSLIYTTGGIYQSIDDIENRNTGSGILSMNTGASYSIANQTVNAVAICRDPSGGVDHFGRPLHYWAAGTAGGISLYNPTTGGIYDSAQTRVFDAIKISNSGYIWGYEQDAGGDFIAAHGPIEGIAASGFPLQASLDAVSDLPVTTGITFGGFASLGYVGEYDVQLLGTDEGLTIFGWNWAIPTPETFWRIHLTSTYVTPLLKTPTIAAYPLDSVTDRSGNGNTLTNNNSTPFTGTSPFGTACPDFDGSTHTLSLSNPTALNGVTQLTFSCYCNPDTIVGEDTMMSRWDASNSTNRTAYLGMGSGAPYFYVSVSTTNYTASAPSAITAGEWHHICGVYDGANVILYVDGVQTVGSALTSALGSPTVDFVIGAEINSGALATHYFDGKISNVFVGTTAWTADEVRTEYARMQAALAGNTTLLTADDIDSVQVAPDGEYAIVTAGDTAHVMDPKTGIILSTDAVGAGTLNDAAIWQKDGADTPSYLLGASTTVEAVQPDERIGG